MKKLELQESTAANTSATDYSTERLTQKYRFSDPNMDLFFLGALGWGASGGLSVGEAFYVASKIEDGNADSWAKSFAEQGEILREQADTWKKQGAILAAGETRLKSFDCYRSAWQFVVPGRYFKELFTTSQKLFDEAMYELNLPAVSFNIEYKWGKLPGHFYQSSNCFAPTILIIGGADTCHEDRFLSQGRYYFDRGYSVALVDLPGQGIVPDQGLYWETDTEQSIGSVIDFLIKEFNINPNKIVLLGMSLGGYFACRAAANLDSLAAVIATPALYNPFELFDTVAKQQSKSIDQSSAAHNNLQTLLWKAGVKDLHELANKWVDVKATSTNIVITE